MAVGRISGPLLKSNLIRNGIDLAFETDLLYLDVNNNRIGIKNASPQYELDVNGTSKSTDLRVTGQSDIGDITISGNTIETTQNYLNLGTLDTVVYQNKAQIDSIEIEGNVISSNDSNANIEFRPNGTGIVDIFSNVNVEGNIHATGNISADGNITLGDADTDSITINAEVASDIIPDQDDTYTLGSSSKQWSNAYVDTFDAGTITADTLTVDGIDLGLRQGNSVYVAENGDDSNTGTHIQDPVATIKHALTLAASGDTIFIHPGVYTEEFPLVVPVGVTVKGTSLRATTIQPTTATRYNNCFKMNGESTVEDVMIRGFYSGGNYFDVTARSDGSATVNVGAAPQGHTYVSGGTVKFEGPKNYPDDPSTVFVTTASGTNTFTVNVGTNNKVHTYIPNSGTATFPGTIVYPTIAGTDYITTASGTGTVTVNVGVTTKAHTYDSGGTITAADSTTYNITGATYDHTTGVLVVTHNGPDLGIGNQVFLSGITFSCAAATYTVTNATYDNVTGDLVITHEGGGDTGVGTNITLANLSFSCDPDTANITGATYDNATGELVFTHDGGAIGSVGAKAFLSNLTFSCLGDNRTFPDDGYAFRFDKDFKVTTRSPYIRNISVITSGSSVAEGTNSADDPRGFNDGDAGKGAYIDGAYATADSKEAAMLFHSATFIVPGVDAIVCTNGVRVEWLNSFTYFANTGLKCFDSLGGFAYDGKTRIRLSGVTGTFAAGDTVTFSSTDASTVETVTIDSVENNEVILIDGKNTDLINFDSTPESISASPSGATATTIENVDVRDFGAEVRMIGSAAVYGNYGLYGDGEGVIVYAIGQNLAYVGVGKNTTNDPAEVIQVNEVTELNGAKIRYNSVDHKGDFRVGDLFYVNQDDGTVNFVASELNINLTDGVTFTSDGNTTFVNGERLDTGNLRLSGNTLSSTSGALNLDSFNGTINLLDNTNITGDLDVTGDLTIGGNITIGDEASDSIEIVGGINSNLIPATTSTYSLGTVTNLWNNVFVDTAIIDDIEINTNYITTTQSNSDLELRSNGTGKVYVPDNNVQVDNDLDVAGTTTLSDTTINGDVVHEGNYDQTGDTTITGNLTVSQDLTVDATAQFEEIRIENNFITTTNTNADLELRASGTGEVKIPDNDVEITGDLTVEGAVNIDNSLDLAGSVTADRYETGDIVIDDNFITTTQSNSNLELRAAGTGSIDFELLSINESTISSTTNYPINLQPDDGNVYISGTGALTLPVGTEEQRPDTPYKGQIRFNDDTDTFEGYDGTRWIQLHGVIDADRDTSVTAEATPGANDGTIRFNVENETVASIDNSRLDTRRLTVDDIQLDGNVISTVTTDTDLHLEAQGTGSVKVENFAFKDNSITNTVSNAVTTFEHTNNGYVKFDGSYGMVIPVGNNSNRPASVYRETGQMRFNTDASRVEIFDGVNWVSVAGSDSGISRADAEDLILEIVLSLG